MSANVIILAAGRGTRMKSNIPKVCHKIYEKSMLEMVYNTCLSISKKPIVVVSPYVLEYKMEYFAQIPDENFAIQDPPMGTGDAARVAIEHNLFDLNKKKTIIVYGDHPFIESKTLNNAIQKSSVVSILSFIAKDQSMKYGRIFTKEQNISELKNKNGNILTISEIKEYKDFKHNETIPTLCNSGIIICDTKFIQKFIYKLNKNNAANEFYLTYLPNIAIENNLESTTIIMNELEAQGINSQEELINAKSYFTSKIL